jgi:hypothetical protein
LIAAELSKCYRRWDLQKGENSEDPEEPEFEDGYENEYMLQ